MPQISAVRWVTGFSGEREIRSVRPAEIPERVLENFLSDAMQVAAGVRFSAILSAAVLMLAGTVRPVCAQVSQYGDFPYQRRFLEEQLRPLIEPDFAAAANADRLVYDYGAVLRYAGVWFEDHGQPPLGDFQASRGAHLWEIRPWFSASYDDVHRGFIRGQYGFQQYEKGDSYNRNSEWQGPFVDIGFYQLDIDEALRRYRCETIDSWAADLTIGRQFLFLGRGIAFALISDAVSLDAAVGDWGGLIFASRSIPHYDNIDISAPNFDRSDRRFFGGQLEYQAFDHHELYAFAVSQRDHSGEIFRAVDPATGMLVDVQRFDYDSEYWGVGAKGEMLFGLAEEAFGIPNLHYYTEFVLQTGKSYSAFGTGRRESIRGWAADAGLTYLWNTPWQPRIELELAQASGDDDRAAPQSTGFGNLAGTIDRGFLGFGYVNTGVSFAPLLANLQFIRLGGAVSPFENCCRDCDFNWLRHMEVGVNGFAYWRPKNQGGTSDIRNDLPGENFLGGEADLFVSWRLSSDLYMLLNYGIFLPNDQSFSDSSGRQFLSWNLNWLL